jgi:bisphosphoglycerate-dependent phosphoglycerate mutase
VNRKRKTNKQREDEPAESKPEASAPPYWEDPVYRFLARLHREAGDSGKAEEAERVADLLSRAMNGALSEEEYAALNAQRKEARQAMKKKRKRSRPPDSRSSRKEDPTVNVPELKKKVFNPQTSTQNVIKSLEAMPTDERKRTIERLPPYLHTKIAKYLESRGY